MSKSKGTVVKKQILSILHSTSNGIGFNELVSKFIPRKASTSYYGRASRPTISACLKELQKQGYVHCDIDTRKYEITAEGNKYAKLSEIVDYILSSTALDSLFDFSAREEKQKSEEISAAYMLATAKTDGRHSIALLRERLRRTQPMLWEIDIVNYATETRMLNDKDIGYFKKAVEGRASIPELETIQKKLRIIWKRLFKGVERLTVVETVRPQLSLERLERKLLEANDLSELRIQNL
jgi:DNA-binding PadR family transcriptional regulator